MLHNFRNTVETITLQSPEYTISSIDGIFLGDLQSFLHLLKPWHIFCDFFLNWQNVGKTSEPFFFYSFFSAALEMFIKIKISRPLFCSVLLSFLKTFSNFYPRVGQWLLLSLFLFCWKIIIIIKTRAKHAARLERHQTHHVSNSLCRRSCHQKETRSGRNEFVVWKIDSLFFFSPCVASLDSRVTHSCVTHRYLKDRTTEKLHKKESVLQSIYRQIAQF